MEDKDVKIDEVSISEEPKNTETTTEEVIAEENEEVKKLTSQLAEINDKYLRMAAELENTRRRAALDAESSARNRSMSVAKKFLPVMDAIEAALKHNSSDEGIQAMKHAMDSAFAQIGITKIESVGQKLNPSFHNAIQVLEKPDEKTETNTILEEMQAGYMFGDSVLRTAMVVVSK